MPTLQEWDSALMVARRVTVDSSPKLVQDVVASCTAYDAGRVAKGKVPPPRKANLAPGPGLAPLQDIHVSPITLLHRLGVITTPPVENLVDVCSYWAYIRYLWAFELPGGTPGEFLRLSEPACGIDFHQKGLMSDHIGVAMAAVLMERFYACDGAIDVDVALDHPDWPVDIGNASPDYIFHNADQTRLYVVECKGTRCRRPAAIDQLRRGTEQVPSLVFIDGRVPTTLVIATQVTRDGAQVFVIDPPDERAPEKPRKTGVREWQISDPSGFDKRARTISQAKVLAYAAADAPALSKMRELRPEIRPRQSNAGATAHRENEFGTFIGTTDVLPVRDRVRVELFQGLEQNSRDANIADNVDALRERAAVMRRLIQARTEEPAGAFATERAEHNNRIECRSVAADGTMLEFRLSHT